MNNRSDSPFSFNNFRSQQPSGSSNPLDINLQGITSIESTANERQNTIRDVKASNRYELDWLHSDSNLTKDKLTEKAESAMSQSSSNLFMRNVDDTILMQSQQLKNSSPMHQPVETTTLSLPVVRNLSTTNQYTRSYSQNDNPVHPVLGLPKTHNQQFTVSTDTEYSRFFGLDAFRQCLIVELYEKYSTTVDIINPKRHSTSNNPSYCIALSGSVADVSRAYDTLEMLFTSPVQRIFCEHSLGFWTCNVEAVAIIQTYAHEKNIMCCCEINEGLGLSIYYLKSGVNSLKTVCTTEKAIKEMITERFNFANITMPYGLDDDLLNEYITALQSVVSNTLDELNSVIIKKNDHLLIFGLTHVIKRIISSDENLKQKYIMAQVKINFDQHQIEYLLKARHEELENLEERYKGVKIISFIQHGYFTGPQKTHQIIKDALTQMLVDFQQEEFTIDSIQFGSMATSENERLIEIGLHYSCLVNTTLNIANYIYNTPASTVDNSANAISPSVMSIDIRKGDLNQQSVDMIVVASTSQYLLENVLSNAGATVQNLVHAAMKDGKITNAGYETEGGNLLCQRIFFLPWTTQKLDNVALRQSICSFFTTAIQHAVKTNKTSLAFPPIGCGKLNFEASDIAEIILDELQRYANHNLKMLITVLPDMGTVYDAFCIKLANLRKRTATNVSNELPYCHTKIHMTIAGQLGNMHQCWKAIEEHVNRCIYHEECDEFPTHIWKQITINTFYKYCLERGVLPMIDQNNECLIIEGSKDAVIKAKTEYYRMKSMIADEALIASYALIAVWLFETDAENVEKYSLKLNALIERACSNNKEYIEFKNERKEICVINFKDMIETCDGRQRRVIRKDFKLPKHWKNQSADVLRCELSTGEEEFQTIQGLFDQTMSGKYTNLKIERIQNQRWYMAYKTHRQHLKLKDTERKLFHGCPESSAEMIIHSCFNRSFAGVNGVAYGVGVYFSTNASYSNGYATPSPNTKRKCMFVANVLVGKTTIGNSKMKTPPDGFHSTTDNNHIFVTYHDDQAYAAYLITYQLYEPNGTA